MPIEEFPNADSLTEGILSGFIPSVDFLHDWFSKASYEDVHTALSNSVIRGKVYANLVLEKTIVTRLTEITLGQES